MAHVDDGTLNTLLDGELEAARAAEVRAHLASCGECSARFEEARRFLAQSAELLDALVPPPVEAPARSVAATRVETPAPVPPPAAAEPSGRPVGAERIEIPAPGFPPTGEVSPARRLPKTAREVAIDIDGSTSKSPAIPPNFLRPGESAPPPFAGARDRWGQPVVVESPARRVRRRLDWPTLAWAASVILALGVGYLANEVRQDRRRQAAIGEQDLAQAAPAAETRGAGAAKPASPATPAPAASRRVAPQPRTPPKGKEVRSTTANAPSGKSAAEALRLAQAPAAGAAAPGAARQAAGGVPTNAVAAAPSPVITQAPAPAAPRPSVAAAPTAAAAEGRLADAAQRAGAAAPRAPSKADRAAAARQAPAAAPAAVAGVVAAAPSPVFRAIDFDQAASALGGTARWIEGLSLQGVKIGPGTLVPGADPAREVVRVVYTDQQGRLIQLDQQRLPSRRTAPAGLGLAWGDTLTAPAAGATRIRWLDRAGLWLSLTGGVPADTLRQVLTRIR